MKKSVYVFIVSLLCVVFACSCNSADPDAKGDAKKVLGESTYNSVRAEYGLVYDFYNGLCKVEKDGLVGFIDSKGKLVIPCTFKNAGHFSDGMARIYEDPYNPKYGYINKEGEVVIPYEYDMAEDFCEGFAVVGIGGISDMKYTFISKNNEKLFDMGKYSSIQDFSEGMARVSISEESTDSWFPVLKYGFINTKGEIVIPCEYSDAESFSQGLAAVELTEGDHPVWGYIDIEGKSVIQPVFYKASPFSEDIAFVNRKEKRKDDDWVAIDKSGNVLFSFPNGVEPKGVYHDGLAKVLERDKSAKCEKMYGYMDKEGKIAIPLKFEDADDFENGIAHVKDCGGMSHYDINTAGEKVEEE
jgi:hypothetical protein